MTNGRSMFPPLLSMAVLLALAPVTVRAEQGAAGREATPAAAPGVPPPVTGPFAEPTREQWDDFADPVRDVVEGWAVERA